MPTYRLWRHGGYGMRVALYARVSTLNGQHPEMQLGELREYGARRGWQITAEYVDQGVSGSREHRLELDRLMSDAHRRKFDLIAVWKIDRFGRSLKHLVNALADLDAYGVAFFSLRDNLDLSTPSGRLMFQVIGAMSEFERSLIRERVISGLAAAQARGVRLGRPRTVVDAAEIARMRASGISCVSDLYLSRCLMQRPCSAVVAKLPIWLRWIGRTSNI
jgi:DNA invertase Pin-like site-specific DNA recombinase